MRMTEETEDQDQPECKLLGCSNPAQGTSGSARFCSDRCQVKYEHIKSDAEDAQRAAEEESREEAGESYWRRTRL